MSFPSARRITYSTCSIHDIENEDVVAKALQKYDNSVEKPAGVGKWELKVCLPTWSRRGKPNGSLSSEQSEALIRCLPEDGTNGFFVAYFERTFNIDIKKSKKRLNVMQKKRKLAKDDDDDDDDDGRMAKKQKMG
jgi:putative methyltransferase